MTLRERWKHTSLPNKLLVATGALVAFGTLFYAGAATVQVFLMRQAARDSAAQVERLSNATNEAIKKAVGASSESLTKSLAESKASFDAALAQEKASLDVSTKQSQAALNASIKASSYELRPYVIAIKFDMVGDFLSSAGFMGQAEVVNAGRTPAESVDSCADVVIKPRTEDIPDEYPCPSPDNPAAKNHVPFTGVHSIAVIGPNAPAVMLHSPQSSVRDFTIGNKTITPEEESKLFSHDGLLRLYFYGELSYRDILGTREIHHSRFCGIYDPQTHLFDVCAKHNRVD